MMALLKTFGNPRIFCQNQDYYRSPAANVLHTFNLRLSSSLPILTQICYGKIGLPFVTALINQLQLTNENAKSFIRNHSSRDNDPLFLIAESFYSDIWSEYNDTTELVGGIIQDQNRNLRTSPIPQLQPLSSILLIGFQRWLCSFHTDKYITLP